VEGPELGYTATWTGDHPELLDTVLVGDDDEESARETAQIVCESHAAKAEPPAAKLDWHEDYPDWVAYADEHAETVAYRCSPDADDRWAATGPEGLELGTHDDLDTAQAACQSHADQIALVDSPGFGATCDAVATSKPEHELGDWSVMVELTAEELGQIAQRGGEIWLEIEQLRAEAETEKRRAKNRISAIQEQIDELQDEARPLARAAAERRQSRMVRCHRQRLPDRTVYSDLATGDTIWEHEPEPGEQGNLYGADVPPPDKPPEPAEAQGDRLLEVLDKAIKRAFAEKTPEAITAAGDAIDAAAAHLQGEQLKKLRARHAEAAATNIFPEEPDPLPPHLDLSDKRNWKRLTSGAYVTSEPEGDNYYVDKSDSGLWQISLYLDKRRRELPGKHKRLKDAFAAAHTDNQRRLRWPPVGESEHVIMSKDGRYQLNRVRGEDDSWPDAWRAELVGLLGSPNTQLNSDDGQPLLEAQTTCQAHADTGRAT
jgi:hypothetical protein